MSDVLSVFIVRINGHRYYVKKGYLDSFLSERLAESDLSSCEVGLDRVFATRFRSDEYFKHM